jgi:hypothetical protein
MNPFWLGVMVGYTIGCALGGAFVACFRAKALAQTSTDDLLQELELRAYERGGLSALEEAQLPKRHSDDIR